MTDGVDPRFWVLQEALASYAADRDDPPIHGGDHLQAAVSLVLRGGEALELLLIKRAVSERDPWSGHVALPGGRRDARDASLLETAVRETLEETALGLEPGSHHLGRLPPVTPVSERLPRLTVQPFVFGVPPDAEAAVASREVASVRWVPLEHLRAPATNGTVQIRVGSDVREFPCFRVAGDVVWGLTYRILTDFLETLPELLPPGAPPSPR